MGIKDWMMGDKTGNESVKVKCTSCNRFTVVKISHSKSFEKWNSETKCGQCNTGNCWEKVE